MRATRRRLTKRNAPRLAGTERIGNFLLAKILIGHTRAVNSGDRHSGDRQGSRAAARGAQ